MFVFKHNYAENDQSDHITKKNHLVILSLEISFRALVYIFREFQASVVYFPFASRGFKLLKNSNVFLLNEILLRR